MARFLLDAAMVAFTKYNAFIDEISRGTHDLHADTLKVALSNTAPNASSDSTLSNAPPPTSANGYPSGGNTLVITSATTSGGVFRLVVGDTTYTAAAGGIGPFRYVVLYNATNTNKLIGYYDYGQSITLNVNDTFTVDFDDANGVLTIV